MGDCVESCAGHAGREVHGGLEHSLYEGVDARGILVGLHDPVEEVQEDCSLVYRAYLRVQELLVECGVEAVGLGGIVGGDLELMVWVN